MKQLISAIALSAAAFSAQAATTGYTDFDDWSDNVVGIYSTDTFNGYNFTSSGGDFIYYGTSVTLGALNYSVTDGRIFGINKNWPDDAGYHTTNYLDVEDIASSAMTIALGGTTNAFSLKLGEYFGTPSNFNVTLSNGDSFTVAGGSAYTFFGVVSTTAFSSVKISGPLLSSIDNVSYGTITPVPEPETYAMLLGGLALMGALARRRSSNDA